MSKESSAAAGTAVVHGTVAEGFEAVRAEFEAFAAAEPVDPGAQLAAYQHGRLVVDLWAGEVAGDSLTGVFSVTKGAAHLVVALLVQEGCWTSIAGSRTTGLSSRSAARAR